jgi:heptaprenyl diphosphate synthase
MKAKRVTFLGLSIALAMILSFVEHQIPALVAIPGVKVGLPNIVMVFLLYRVGWKEMVTVSIVRIILVSMLFGNVQTMTFSIAGAILSLFGMILLKKTSWFSCITVSIVGGILHNVGQIIAACFWTSTAEIAYYLPVLLVSGIIAGAVIGIIAGILVKRLEKWKL